MTFFPKMFSNLCLSAQPYISHMLSCPVLQLSFSLAYIHHICYSIISHTLRSPLHSPCSFLHYRTSRHLSKRHLLQTSWYKRYSLSCHNSYPVWVSLVYSTSRALECLTNSCPSYKQQGVIYQCFHEPPRIVEDRHMFPDYVVYIWDLGFS